MLSGWMLRVSVTMAAFCMGMKEMGMQTGYWGTYNQSLSENESRYAYNHCREIKEALASNKMEIDWK